MIGLKNDILRTLIIFLSTDYEKKKSFFYNLRDASSLAPDTSELGRDPEEPPAAPEDSEKPKDFDNYINFRVSKISNTQT